VAGAWARLVWHSVGVAVLVAAAQLGVGQALGIVGWDASFVGSDSGWRALLTWIGFCYAVAVLAGTAVGRRAIRRRTRGEGFAARVIAVIAAVVGAALAVGIAWLPARGARPPVSVHPELVVAMTAAAGIVVGAVLSLVALSAPPVAGAVRATTTWIWLVAIGSAVAGVLTHKPYDAPRLAVLDAPSLVPSSWWSGPNLMIGVAAVLGLAVAAVARFGGARRIGIGLSGLAGPAIVAAAYLIAGAGGGGDQVGPFRASLIAVAAGACASIAVAVPGQPSHSSGRDRAERTATAVDAGPPAEFDEPDPTEVAVPAPGPFDNTVMGQPVRGFDNDYANWLGGLGEPGRHSAAGQR